MKIVVFRALMVWLVIIAAETVLGVLRGLFLTPLVGDLPARQIGIPIGSAIIFTVAYLFIRWVHPTTRTQLVFIGVLWVVWTVLFEVGLGRLVFDLAWDRIAEDYDPTRGGFLGFGLLFMLIAPWLAAKARRLPIKG